MTHSVLAARLQSIQPSATLAINARANELARQGKQITNLSVGEPDFDTADFIKQAAIDALNAGFTKYTAVDGILPLKEAIIEKFQRDNQLHYKPEEIIVSTGAKQSLFNACMALLNPGDEVIIPAPYWVSYPALVQLAEAKPVFVPCSIKQRFKLTADDLAKAITAKTKLFILNSPSNPSGMAYTREELAALANILKQHPDIYIISDDIYEHMLWSKQGFHSLLQVEPSLRERCLIVNGVSKAYAMTGWRIGYTAGPKAIIAAMKKIQSQSTSNPCSIAQKAALAALSGSQQRVAVMRDSFQKRQQFFVNGLNQLAGIDCAASDGTFYCFPDITALLQRLKLKSDVDFCHWLLNTLHIAAVPGSSFGLANHVRFSIATKEKLLEQALMQLQDQLKNH